jgi:hypothetical protein
MSVQFYDGVGVGILIALFIVAIFTPSSKLTRK